MIIWKTNFADARVAARRHPPPPVHCPSAPSLLHRSLGLHGAAEGGGQRDESGHCCNQSRERDD